MEGENKQIAANKSKEAFGAFLMPKIIKKEAPAKPVKTVPQTIATYNVEGSTDLSSEIEEFSKLSVYSASKMITHRALQEKTQYMKFLQFQNIEKCVLNNNSSSDLKNRLQKYFLIGVVVEKRVLTFPENQNKKYPNSKAKTSCYIRFKLSDLLKYKSSLLKKIQNYKSEPLSKSAASKMSIEELDKITAYKLMNFTPDRYKVNEFILFDQAAEEFSKTIKYGDMVAIFSPTVMDQKYNSGICLSAKSLSQIMVVGKCSDYSICTGFNCCEFLNNKKQTKCMLHVEEDNDNVIKYIKANRANLRSDYVDSK